MSIEKLKRETFLAMANSGEIAHNSDNEQWVNVLIQIGADFIKKEYEEKLRWIPVEEKLPEIGQRVLLKNEFYEYVGFLSKNKKDFRALTVEISYSNEKINGVTHWRFYNAT